MRNESIANKIKLVDQLGRRKLKDATYAVSECASTADLLWIAPRKYWTCSKHEENMQERALSLADLFLANSKDVIIVSPKDFHFKSKSPQNVFHKYETPGHTVLCSRKLPKLVGYCGPSSDENLLTTAIVQSLLEGSCLGVGQSYRYDSSSNSNVDFQSTSQLSSTTTSVSCDSKETNASPAFAASQKSSKPKEIPKIENPQSKRQAKGKAKGRTSKSPEAKRKSEKTQRKVTFDDDDGAELGDHASNVDAKPDYAKQHAKEKNKAKKKVEESFDDCGENVSAIEFEDNTAFTAFVEDDTSTCCPSSDNESVDCLSPDENSQVFLKTLDELFLFSDQLEKSQVSEQTYATFLSEEEQQSFHIAADLGEPYCSHRWTSASHPIHVMEVFGGYGGVTRIAIKRKLKVGKFFDINIGIDLTRPEEKAKLLSYIRKYEPSCIVMGPPCTSFSAWARFNRLHYPNAWARSYAIGKPLAELSVEIARLQHKHGRFYIIENPWSSAIWQLPSMAQLVSQSFIAYCDQCRFGLVDMNNKPTKKATAFISNHEELIRGLNVACDGHHAQHSLLAGKIGGVSKTRFAQRWPYRLCKTIVDAVARLCSQKPVLKYQSTSSLKQQFFSDPTQFVFAGSETKSSSAAPPAVPICPGCKSHAYRRDPRHNRIAGSCKFPDDTSDVLTCPACVRNLPSHHPSHNKNPGECHWAEAVPRLGGSSSSSSRGPRPTEHRVPDASLDAPSATRPPQCPLGTWSAVYDSYWIDVLNELALQDGWHELEDGTKALVLSNSRYTREPQPRFDNKEYSLRSTYARFLEHPHAHGTWWQVEDATPYAGKERSLGFPVIVMIHVFLPEVGDSPTEKRIEHEAPAPTTLDEPPPRRRNIQLPLPREVEYGEKEQEVPEIPIGGREPAVPQANAEEEAEQLAIEKAEEEKAIAKAEQIDWSATDLGTVLRELKSDNRSLVTRALRRLHLRWYHAPATRMQAILSKVGISGENLKLVKDVCDTCRICRAWKKPSDKSATQIKQAEGFNDRVQIDLLYVGEYIIAHMCDECTRFSVADILKSREADDILSCIKRSWIKYFGVPKLLVSDSEGALSSEEAAIWAERLNTSFKLLPRNSHATTVERHHETLRQLIHKIAAQCRTEGLTISMQDVVSEATTAKNSLLVINGYTPFTAVMGRTPNLLGEYEQPTVSAIADNVGGQSSKHTTRLREIAVASMLEHTARERIKRANDSQTRIATEQLSLQVNDLVDIYRTPRTKDNVGWRGPCKVVSVEDNQVNVQWNGRIIACRTQDVRKALMYPVMLQERNEDMAFDMIRKHATGLQNNADTFMIVHTPQGWKLSKDAKQHPLLFQALLKVAYEIFYMPRCVGGRIGRGTTGTKGMLNCSNSVLIWWPVSQPQLYKSMMCHANLALNLKEQFGEQYQDVCWIRLFGIDEENVAPVRATVDDIPHLAADPPGPPAAVPYDAPFEVDDHSMPSGGGRDNMSIMSRETRAATPMNTDPPGHPPHPPPQGPPNRQRRTPTNTDRTRSTRRDAVNSNQSQPPGPPPALPPHIPMDTNRTAISTGRTLSTLLAPNTASPVVSTNSTQQATTGTITPQQIHSPRGDKRTPEQEHQHSPKHHKSHAHTTPASSSTDVPPLPHPAIHEPLLPIQDEDNETDQDISDLETLFEPETEANLMAEEKWRDHVFVHKPPSQYHNWQFAPGIDELCEWQQHYLLNSTVCTKTLPTRVGNSKDECFELEIGPTMAQLFYGIPALQADEVCVFKTNAKGSEVVIEKNFDALSAAEIKANYALVEAAVRKELASFMEHKTFTRALKSSCSNICSSRWVLRWKEIDGQRAIKARLTIRGFEDTADVSSYASTASRWSQRLIISIAVQQQWPLWVTDISTAFLRGMTFEELAQLTNSQVRNVAFTAPKGWERYFSELEGLRDFNFTKEVFKLSKAVYGLRDAPRAWRLRLDKERRKLGGSPLITDRALYAF